MSRNSHHNLIANQYLNEHLGGFFGCPKKNCPGKLIPVLACYPRIPEQRRDDDSESRTLLPVEEELECTTCGKVVKSEASISRLKRGENQYSKWAATPSRLPRTREARGQRGKERKRRKRLQRRRMQRLMERLSKLEGKVK